MNSVSVFLLQYLITEIHHNQLDVIHVHILIIVSFGICFLCLGNLWLR